MRKADLRNATIVVLVAALLFFPAIEAFSTGKERVPLSTTGWLEDMCGSLPALSNNPITANVGNVQLTSAEGDELHPTLAQAFDGSFVAAYDKQITPLTGHCYFLRSTNNGDTWNEIWNTDTDAGDMASGLQNWPVICNVPGGNALFGSWNDEAQGTIFFFNVTDPSNPESYAAQLGGYDASDWDYDRYMFTIEAYNSMRLAVGHVGHIIYAGYDLPSSTQIITFTEGYQGSFGITGDEDYPYGYNCEIGITDDYYWYVWDSPDESDISYLVVKWGDPIEQSDAHLWPETEFHSDANFMDPAFDASGTNLCMVYMTDENIYGDWDLAVKYSTDEGGNWQDGTFPSQPQVDEKAPEIFLSGSSVFCTFVRNGNLYLTTSTDLGQTWDEPEQINDQDGTVVDEPGAVAVSQAGIAWEDTRNGNIDIYYAQLPTAIFNVDSISGGVGVSATVSNTGTVAGEQVAWSIELSGLVFLGGMTAGTIDVLEPGATETISSGLVFGLGPTTITVTVGGASQAVSGMVLGPLVLGL